MLQMQGSHISAERQPKRSLARQPPTSLISHRPHTVRYFADPSFAAHSLSCLSYFRGPLSCLPSCLSQPTGCAPCGRALAPSGSTLTASYPYRTLAVPLRLHSVIRAKVYSITSLLHQTGRRCRLFLPVTATLNPGPRSIPCIFGAGQQEAGSSFNHLDHLAQKRHPGTRTA